MNDNSVQVDLTNCDREPIHILGRIQSIGFLLAVGPDWTVTRASENLAAFTGASPAEVIGRPLTAALPDATIHEARNKLTFLRGQSSSEMISGVAVRGSDQLFDLSVSVTADEIILEFEPGDASSTLERDIANVRGAVARFAAHRTSETLYNDAVRFTRLITGFDRVMLYRFKPDDSGEVVAESVSPGLVPFKGLHYPASDIPRQARALYLRNPIRMIADVADAGARIVPELDAHGQPLDLTSSTLRAVSSIHLEYLRNMGVGASLSISLVVDGRLWGLIACHHRRPLALSLRRRSASLLFGQMLSLILQIRNAEEERALDSQVQEIGNEISRVASVLTPPDDLLVEGASRFRQLIQASGVAVLMKGEVQSRGETPPADVIRALARQLSTQPQSEVFAISRLADFHPAIAAEEQAPAGLLAIPISRRPGDYILFFRPEQVRQVNWAGDPTKPVTLGPNGARLTPRKSFEAWSEEVRGESRPWTSSELRAASQLRVTILEIVLRFTDEASRERAIAAERQELLIAELNHRVRNILGLVRGLVLQSRGSAESPDEFARLLDKRIQSLARAHDQITQRNWSHSPLRGLIEVEAATYLNDKKDRVIVTGEEVELSPAAFTTLALVMHELITNSAKYGALSDSSGRVDIKVSKDQTDGGYSVDWAESGGPAVQVPRRRGFGMAIIERSVPFELQGQAKVDFGLSGLQARFWLPAVHVRTATDTGMGAPVKAGVRAQPAEVTVPLRVLVVEDNLLIAMEAEDIFREMGAAEVTVVSSVKAAERQLAGGSFDFVLLDVNLGQETSVELARALRRDGIPFVFATGYGEQLTLPPDIADVMRIAKPYSNDTIRTGVTDTLRRAARASPASPA